MNKQLRNFLLLFLISIIVFLFPENSVNAASLPQTDDDNIVVVLDPGHGGDNLGADYNGFHEKEMNLKVANAMCEELQKYEGITVYLTHHSVNDNISIKERVEYAASVDADFLYCLHFNMSPGNILFGSEVWISAFGDENRKGYQFGLIQMDTMKEMGLFLRGIKTKLNDEGTDYYGILRFGQELSVPTALIEHCHIDHENDVSFCDSDEDLIAFGKADATSVAKYFGLKSKELDVDYSNYEKFVYSPHTLYAKEDTTDPDICLIEEKLIDTDKMMIGIQITGQDYDSPMQYYSYSIDGGKTYTPYIAWPGEDSFTLNIPIPENVSPIIKVKAVNQYDRFTISNTLSGYPVFTLPVKDMPEELPEESKEVPVISTVSENTDFDKYQAPVSKEDEKPDNSFLQFLKISLLIVIIVFVILLIARIIVSMRKRNHRRRR